LTESFASAIGFDGDLGLFCSDHPRLSLLILRRVVAKDSFVKAVDSKNGYLGQCILLPVGRAFELKLLRKVECVSLSEIDCGNGL